MEHCIIKLRVTALGVAVVAASTVVTRGRCVTPVQPNDSVDHHASTNQLHPTIVWRFMYSFHAWGVDRGRHLSSITSSHRSHIRSHHLSLLQPFTPDLKLISFTNPFLYSLSFFAASTDLEPVPNYMGSGVFFVSVCSFLHFLFLATCGRLSWSRSAFQSTLNSSISYRNWLRNAMLLFGDNRCSDKFKPTTWPMVFSLPGWR